jgi:hypothetical protein
MEMNKKITAAFLSAALTITALAGCNDVSQNTSSNNGNSTDLIDTSAGIYLNDIYNSAGITIIKYVHEYIKNNSGITYNDVFNNVWKLFTVTFKIKDTIPNDIKTCHIEW